MMKIIHIINSKNRPGFKDGIDALGVKYDYKENLLGKCIHFEISEDDANWPEVCDLVEKYELGRHMVYTKFTPAEKRNAAFLEIGAWHNEYPQPENDFNYREVTYNRPSFCEKCEIGKSQQGPFRMRREPKWGSRHIMQLNWVYDEFFVRSEVWHDIFKPFGVGCQPVLKHRTGEELKTVVQLDVTQVAESPLCIDGHPTEVCAECGQEKYKPIKRGFFPKFSGPIEGNMVKTQEWFGSGGSAHRAVIISNQLYKEIETKKIKGAEFKPLASE